jgi:hypothetical protein
MFCQAEQRQSEAWLWQCDALPSLAKAKQRGAKLRRRNAAWGTAVLGRGMAPQRHARQRKGNAMRSNAMQGWGKAARSTVTLRRSPAEPR